MTDDDCPLSNRLGLVHRLTGSGQQLVIVEGIPGCR
jgi:hypothetical protein